MALSASSIPSDVPAVMKTRSGVTGKPRVVYSSATAARADAMPDEGPYPLCPSRIACSTAAMRCGGGWKPKAGGLPTLR